MAWIDGGVDAGLPVKLVTPINEVWMVDVRSGELTATWQEILRVVSRGGTLIGG